jgi:hypothetical protein
MRRIGIVGCVLLTLLFGGVLAQEFVTVSGGDDAALRAFIARYVGAGTITPVTVAVGDLPELAFAIPTPPATTIIGTVARQDGANPDLIYYEILLENAIAPKEVLAFYKQALTDAGWSLIFEEDSSTTGGFTEFSLAAGNFCLNTAEANLAFDASTNPQMPGKTLINVRVQTPADAYQCQSLDQPVVDITFTLIPPLRIPEGVTVMSNISGGLSYYAADGRSTSVMAVLTATLPLAQLAEAYNTQLATVGWVQTSNNLTDRSAFSTWAITASDGSLWQGGFLLLADTTTPGQFNAMVWVEE